MKLLKLPLLMLTLSTLSACASNSDIQNLQSQINDLRYSTTASSNEVNYKLDRMFRNSVMK